MAIKFYRGLGDVSVDAQTSAQDGRWTQIFSGSVFDAGDLNGAGVSVQTTHGQIDPTTTITSQDSALAYHSTLFEDFDLRAESVYNFYTGDEQVNFSADSSASLADLPRYVRVSWDATPVRRVLTPSRKGLRPPDSRIDTSVGPVLSIGTAKTAAANGYIAPGSVQALLVPPQQPVSNPKFDQDLFLSSPSAAGKNAADHQHVVGEFHVTPIPPSPNRTRVNFIDPSIAGALDPNRIAVASDHTHLAALAALSKLAGALEVVSEFNQDVPTRNPPPKFPAPIETPGLMYTGYVLERYTLDSNGSMTLSKTIDIDDPTQTSYIDREVVFGGRYSYRIRSVVQWTRPSNYSFPGLSTLDRLPGIDTSASSLKSVASYYSGDWSDWARTRIEDDLLPDPPDELTVRPVSRRKQVHVVWKMPNDPQRDISAVRLLRSVVRDGEYSDWVQLGEFVPANGMYVDSDVEPWEQAHESYMYAMYSVSYHGEHSPLSERLEVRLTDRDRYLGEEPIRQVGPRGDDPFLHARGPQDPPSTELVVSGRAAFYVRGGASALPLFDRGYVVEVQSIATGQRAEIALSVDTTDVGVGPGGGRGRA